MKRYLLFDGADHQPEGGVFDFRGDCDTITEAMQAWGKTGPDGWAHIVDLREGKVTHWECEDKTWGEWEAIPGTE